MIDSPRQLTLRVLTGRHAGVELLLNRDEYTIGHGPPCDIVISDWPAECMKLVVTNSDLDMVTISFKDEATTSMFGLNEPCLIGEIVVTSFDAVGGSGRLSDVAILKKLLAKSVPVEEKRSITKHWIVAATVVTLSVVCGAGLQTSRSVAATKTIEQPALAQNQLDTILRNGKYPEIKVVTLGRVTYVDGLVKDRTQFKSLTESLKKQDLQGLVQRFAAASDISDAIGNAVGQPGISVSYMGAGKFEIVGRIPDEIRQKLSLEKLRGDMGHLVKEITFAKPDEINTSNTTIDDNVRQTQGYEFRIAKDGSKYFIPH